MDQEKKNNNEFNEELEIDNEASPSFKDELRAVGQFFKKMFSRSTSSGQELETNDDEHLNNDLLIKVESNETLQTFQLDSNLQENEQVTDQVIEQVTEHVSEQVLEQINELVSEQVTEQRENLSPVVDNSPLNISNNDIQIENNKSIENEEELEIDDESAPSFKDELRAIGQFFKKMFGHSSTLDQELETNNDGNLQNSNDKLSTKDETDETKPHTQLDSNFQENKQETGQKEELSSIIDNGPLINSIEEIKEEKKKKRKWFNRREKPQPSEEQIQLKKVKFYKGLTSTFLFLFIFFSVGFLSFTSTSKKEFCVACHEMRPEHYTLLASSHSDVECVDCHTNPNLEAMLQEKVKIFNMFTKKITDRADIPIKLKGEISDESCEKCHDMSKRTVSASGDIIIPHTKHKQEGISCLDCHSGVAHGKISESNLTKRSNLSKWNLTVAKSVMYEKENTIVMMGGCMSCHTARDATLECGACHETAMLPESHKNPQFALTLHGEEANNNIESCHDCHKYMTVKEIEVDLTKKKQKNYNDLTKNKKNQIPVPNYIYENDFCRNCHSKRPPSHEGNFFLRHGALANKNLNKCYGCHNVNAKNTPGKIPVTSTTCSKCHPSSHEKSNYKVNHPEIGESITKVKQSCFQNCHIRKTCVRCHANLN